MSRIRQSILTVAAFALLFAASAWMVRGLQFSYAHPTPAEYLDHLEGGGELIPPGKLSHDGASFSCARFPAIYDPTLDDYAAAYFGFILLNRERFEQMPLTLKRYAYAHECGHQYVGFDEDAADCYAIRRGRKDRWLDAAAMDEICGFISRAKGDAEHAAGTVRCRKMRACFAASERN